MTEQSSRKFWQTPWGYGESSAIVAGIALVGVMLQLSIGSFDFFLLARPINKIIGLAFILFATLMGTVCPKSRAARFLTSIPLSVALIVAILALTIIMGLTPQVGAGADSRMALGFDSMTTNWSFVLLYGFVLLSLGATIACRLRRFRVGRDIPFTVQHVGLWLVLAASGLGYADMERYVMYVQEGETQWRVYNDNGAVKELPIAIKLNDFDMEVYPPRLAIIDRESGEVQPTQKPQYYQIDPDQREGELGEWRITIHEYIHDAVRSSDSTYRHVPMPGATPAIWITADSGKQSLSGWVSGTNALQGYMTLPISDSHSIVMTPADPRRYLSEVEVYTQQGSAVQARIEVNSPLWLENWTIYQYGYDNAAGDLSSYSSFELVYDPWVSVVYIGVILIMIGSLVMILQGRRRR